MSQKDLYIKVNGELINVSEEVYITYYRMESRARGTSKDKIKSYMETKYGYNLKRTIQDIRKNYCSMRAVKKRCQKQSRLFLRH